MHKKWGAFHWIVATNQIELWNGSGTIPGTQCNNHSSRAEGFGLLTALTFLEKYLIATQTIPPINSKPINTYCDNLVVIQQISYLQNWQIPNLNNTIVNDYNLTKEIFTTIQCIPIPISMHHVKGQRLSRWQTNNWWTTPWSPTQYNLQWKAWEALENYPENISPHPTLPASHPHLKIKRQTIVRLHKECLWEATQLPTYHKYLYQKFQWYHVYDRMAHHWIHNVKILFPWLPPNLKDDPWVDPYQSIPQKFPNYYFWHSVPYLLNPPRNMHPHSPMQPPISEQDLSDFTTQASPTFTKLNINPNL